ncbi:hypothetical protein [Ferroacidibacillus organovorans]|uniref:Cytochrome b561 domain-containing protein n=1 Tax=Ferroacidibacillus organovorans TaxID=1765683 RepID=A0A101XPG0_9BACL|nr:hypothetical protein [Ferroacidibacillus organovorans]KUO95006.1 hypothetical protein ATW55_05070 [Ferroacidibacillus organovorans]
MLLDAYIALIIASAIGAILFVGYTFRVKIAYPIRIVQLHVLTTLVAMALFTIATWDKIALSGYFAHATFGLWFLISSYLIGLITLILGFAFYWQFDAKFRVLRLRFIAIHLTLAGISFIFFTSAVILYQFPVHIETNRVIGSRSGAWYILHRNEVLRQKYDLAHQKG